jgi:5-methylcytosine-specific restriction endonuclease McrA
MPRGVYPRKKKELHIEAVRDAHVGHGMERSPHWPTVQHKHLKKFPTCAACGGGLNLNVHHKKPFHLFPELELEPTNLITLCMDGEKDCHIKLGHGSNFKAYNPNVVEDVATVKANFSIELLNETAVVAKKARLLV